jgi:hypothetical protein
MPKYSLVLCAFIALSLTAFSCREAEPLAPEQPVATLLSPVNGDTIPGGDVQVRIYLQNFTMIPAGSGAPNAANEGHAIYYLDAVPLLVPGEPATTANGSFIESTDTAYVWSGVAPGQHTFSVQLVNNDSSPLFGPMTVRATVTVK